MQRLSSNSTLFFKFFIPIFWLVFFGSFLLAVFVYGEEMGGRFTDTNFRLGAIFFYVTGAALFYFTLLPLKRVEADENFAYATNYFKTYRYPWHNIEAVHESSFLTFSVATLVLKESGNFGRNIRFIGSRRLMSEFWKQHPKLKPQSS